MDAPAPARASGAPPAGDARAAAVRVWRAAVVWARRRTLVEALVLALASAHALGFLYVALSRASYPVDLEWMEGGQLLHSFELMKGRALYRAPTAEFIAFPYQPLYPAVVAIVSFVTGLSLTVGRAVSIASTLALAGVLGVAGHRATRSVTWAWVSVGLFFSAYRATGFWLDLVRVDSLFLALLVGALLASLHPGRRALLASAALMFLAYKTKQLALFFVPIPLFAGGRKPRELLPYAIAVGALLAVDQAVEDLLTHGYYSFFVFKLPQAQPYDAHRMTVEYWATYLREVPVLALAGAYGALRAIDRRGEGGRGRRVWALAAIAATASGAIVWSRPGGAPNNFLPACVFFALTAACLLADLRRTWAATWAATVPLALLLAHFVQQGYDPRWAIPSAGDRASGLAFIDYVKRLPGPVLLHEPWYAVMAGKPPSYHPNALWEEALVDGVGRDSVATHLRRHDYGHVVMSGAEWLQPPELERYYEKSLELPPGRIPVVKTGLDAVPFRVYVPRANAP